MKKSKTKIMVECSIVIALSTALSLVKIIPMPLGGSVTLLSMLPVCYMSIRHGLKWGLGTSFVYSCIQLALDFAAAMGWGLSAARWVGMIAFDYIIPFTVLGLSGLFAKKGFVGVMSGTALAIFLRFVSHIISGSFVFDIWMPEGWGSPFVYSVAYNGAYMLPELIMTLVGAAIVYKALANRNL
ncbi:MAG: energy-coupled thiamine transporter ThiT [Clostridia bacterium]|nr:energy-coupled thiamine transporter ThiT [Clostridia bacterium]